MQFLSLVQITDLHKELIKKFGGSYGLRDKGLLESAVGYPKLLYSIQMERDVFTLAAAYGYHLIKNHAFIDGNKRIGTLAILIFLKINNISIQMPQDNLYKLAMDIANSKVTEKEIVDILSNYSNFVFKYL